MSPMQLAVRVVSASSGGAQGRRLVLNSVATMICWPVFLKSAVLHAGLKNYWHKSERTAVNKRSIVCTPSLGGQTLHHYAIFFLTTGIISSPLWLRRACAL